jgi:hypothetical protein
MKDFNANREEFLKKIGELESELNLPEIDIRVYQLPEPGIKLPDDIDADIARRIMKIYNEVFKK